MNPKCIVEGCTRKALRRPEHSPYSTLCNYHYNLAPRVKMKNKGSTCSVQGCKRFAVTKGMCHMHYQRPSMPKRSEYLRKRLKEIYDNPNSPLCLREGCSKKAFRSGLCITHYTYERPSYRDKYGSDSILNKLAKPCQLCGYSKLPSHKHRRNPSAGYIPENVIYVCANCHREIHAGITNCP